MQTPVSGTIVVSQKESIIEVAKAAVLEFLRKMDVTPPKYERDAELEASVEAITRTWDFKDQVQKHIITGLIMAKTSYSHVSDVEARAAIAVYMAILIALDDPVLFDSAGAQEFWRGICDGSLLQSSGILAEYAKVVLSMGRFYSNFSSGTILGATVRFLNGEMIGNPESNAFVEPNSRQFVEFSRDLNGGSEAFAAFIWSKLDFPDEYSYIQVFPDVCDYINYTNDILSFYKEEQDGEVASYIHARSRLSKKTLIATLYEVIDDVVAAVERIRCALGDGKAREAWDSFARGYVGYHVNNPRYRLEDVFGAHTIETRAV